MSNFHAPADWDWKQGTWLSCAYSDDGIPIFAQGSMDAEPRIIGTYTPQRAAGLALGLLQAVSKLDEHQQMIGDINTAEPDTPTGN